MWTSVAVLVVALFSLYLLSMVGHALSLLRWPSCSKCGARMESESVKDPWWLLGLVGFRGGYSIPRRGTEMLRCPKCGRKKRRRRWLFLSAH